MRNPRRSASLSTVGCCYIEPVQENITERATYTQVATPPPTQGVNENDLESTLYYLSTPQGVANACQNYLMQPLHEAKVVRTLGNV